MASRVGGGPAPRLLRAVESELAAGRDDDLLRRLAALRADLLDRLDDVHALDDLTKTTCLPSSQGVLAVQRKNWDPFVPGPALAMLSTPAPVCFSRKFSSSNFSP